MALQGKIRAFSKPEPPPLDVSRLTPAGEGTVNLAAEHAAAETTNAIRFLRIGSVLIICFQFFYIGADFYSKPTYAKELFVYHLINFAVAAAALAMTCGPYLRKYWQLTTLIFCTALIATGTRMSVLSQDVEPRFVSVVLFSIGCAAFVPWGARWQALMNVACVSSFAIDAYFVPFHDQ